MTRALPWLILLLGVLQPLTGALAPLTGIGTPIGGATAGIDAPEQPLPFFFSIWSVIFLAYAGFGFAGLRWPAVWFPRVGWPLLVAGIANIVWMLSAQLIAVQPLDFLLLAPVLGAAWVAAARVETLRPSTQGHLLRIADLASGLLAGWASVAVAISVPLTIRSFTGLGPTDFPWPMFWTTFAFAALAAWIFTARISRSLWFFAALGWGLVGIVLNNWLRTEMHWIALVAGAGTATILLLRVTRRANRSRSGS
ncbi:MAG: hypothetical protein RLO80_06845 [Hyphomonas sp.]